MVATPMRPVENLLALAAALLIAGSLFPWSLRLACAFAAIGAILLLAAMRFRAHGAKKQRERTFDVYAQVARMREDRAERFGRFRPGVGMRYPKGEEGLSELTRRRRGM
jgi:hypothetical protein